MATDKSQPLAGFANRSLGFAENAVYGLVGLVLMVGALVVLGDVVYGLVSELKEGVEPAVIHALDGLLLVFILLELLAGVRATITERKLIAEPFLIVGIIASIKEIIVVALEAKADGPSNAFDNSMMEIGVLGVLILLLSVAGFLVRRKEREPAEDSS